MSKQSNQKQSKQNQNKQNQNKSKQIKSTIKREGIIRILLFIVLSSLTYLVQDYSWAVTLITLVAIYLLITGVQKLIRKK